MLHIGVFAHPLLMFRNFVKGAEKELVIQSARIADQKPNDRSLFNLALYAIILGGLVAMAPWLQS